LNSINQKVINYPIGTADFYHLFGNRFDSLAFQIVPQFLFMGSLDENDAVQFKDAYSIAEKEVVFEILGREMLAERWRNCKRIYDSMGIKAQFRTYPDIAHEHPGYVHDDILKFFKTVIAER
jgi:hypothetical protein